MTPSHRKARRVWLATNPRGTCLFGDKPSPLQLSLHDIEDVENVQELLCFVPAELEELLKEVIRIARTELIVTPISSVETRLEESKSADDIIQALKAEGKI